MKSKNLIIVLVVLLIVLSVIYLFASLGKGGRNSASAAEGINGYVVTGPVCPVPKEGDESCDDKPVRANIIVKNKEDNVIKNIETLDDGSFSVQLSPGKYIIYNDSGGGLKGSKPEYVTVGAGNFAEVKIRIDTGIR